MVENRLEDIFEEFKDNTSVNFFNNSKYVGIEIAVSRTGWGFGAITLAHNLEEGTWHLDDECSSKERVTQFFHDAVPHIVDALYRKGNVKFEDNEDFGWVVLENPNSED